MAVPHQNGAAFLCPAGCEQAGVQSQQLRVAIGSHLRVSLPRMIDTPEGPIPEPPMEDLVNAPRRAPSSPEAAPAGRTPPHSIEAEQGILGCLMLDASSGLDFCLERIREPRQLSDAPSDKSQRGKRRPPGDTFFYELKHQLLFEAMIDIVEAGQAVDIITVKQFLADRKQLEAVGGVAYLNTLMDSVPSAANLEYYFNIVWDKYLLRKTVRTCTEIVTQAYEHEGEVNRLLDEVETRIHSINDERAGDISTDMKKLVHAAIDRIEEYHKRKGQISGVASGYSVLDRMTDGMHAGEMIVIAARPSMGKTSLAMNIVENVTLGGNIPVGVFSLEMTAEALVTRMIFSNARLNFSKLRDGVMGDHDFPRINAAAGKLHKAPLYIDDTPGLSILQLRAKARRMHTQYGIKLIVIDYLQLLHSTSRRAIDNRQQEVSEISSGIKALAKELKVPVIVLCQLNREMEREKNRKPRLSDLRESGAIEQDADLVGLLYKVAQDEDAEGADESEGLPVNLLIAKQRNGPTGDIPLTFLKAYTRFEPAARISDEDVPHEN